MKKILLISTVFVLIIACSKDKFQTKPQISIKSYNTKVVQSNQNLEITFVYTDKEGDLGNGQFVYYPIRLNINTLPVGTGYVDSVVNVISGDLPNIDKGDINLALPWVDLHKSNAENDTILLKFVVVDRAGNRSDTLTSDRLVILKN